MPHLSVLRWLALHLARRPLFWALAMGAVAIPVALQTAWPLTISGPEGHSDGAIYDLAFVSGVAGALLGGAAVASATWLFGLLPEPSRFGHELISVLLPCTVLAALVWHSAALTTAIPPEGPFFPDTMLALLHLSALMVILLRMPGPTGPRLLALPLLCWALPAILRASPWPWPAAAVLLAPHAGAGTGPLSTTSLTPALTATGALLLAGLALRPSPSRA